MEYQISNMNARQKLKMELLFNYYSKTSPILCNTVPWRYVKLEALHGLNSSTGSNCFISKGYFSLTEAQICLQKLLGFTQLII